MQFLLIQGSFNSYTQLKTNWLPKLQENLEPMGHQILLPQLPFDDWDAITKNGPDSQTKQSLTSWLKAFDAFISTVDLDPEFVILSHSLGPLFVLHLLQKYEFKLDAAFFICPFLEVLKKSSWQINHVNKTFYAHDFNYKNLKKLVPRSYVVYGTDDPYVENTQSLDFAQKMGSSLLEVIDGGHLNKPEYSDLILELCKTRVKLT